MIKKNIKFGIRVTQKIIKVLRLDEKNGNILWRYGIAKEINAVMVVFKLFNEKENPPTNYQEIICHMIFDIKTEDFRRKARYVAGGHATVATPILSYDSVVSQESVRVYLMLAALNDLEVKKSDIQNAYLTAPCSEKIWTTLGSEFGPDLSGKKALIVRAVYGIKSAGASFRNHLAECMINLGYLSFLSDPYVWFKEEKGPSDGAKYYA